MASYDIDSYGLAVGSNGNPIGGIKPEAVDVRAGIEAQMYSLLNPYLDDRQKAIIEVWFQLPMSAFFYSYLLSCVFMDSLLLKPVFCAIYFTLFVGWLTTLLKASFFESYMPIDLIFGNTLLQLFVACVAIFSGATGWISAIAVFMITFTGIPNGGAQLASAWATSRHPLMNAKYGAAKELFAIGELPFEKYLIDSLSSQAQARGKAVLCWVSVILLLIATAIWGF